jgi:outer membrane protein OmpA-like peptidoglycan-associated protein
MKKLVQYIILLLVLLFSTSDLRAQSIDSITSKKILLRDSLDYLDKKISINTSSNEFSPIPYKGGLMYISNKPIEGAKVSFNKVYWTANPKFNIIDKEQQVIKTSKTITKYLVKSKTDDFTAPTSNDNNILVNYKKVKTKWNSVEKMFSNFSTDQAFAYDDSSQMIVYAKQSNRKVNGKKHWELWQAFLIDGKLKQKKRLVFIDKDADYLYPFIANNTQRLYFSSDKKGSIGGYDIYYVERVGNAWQKNPIALDSNINTKYDEIAPFVNGDSVYFSSNKKGGLGGFDIYYLNFKDAKSVYNIGYPINTGADEVSLKKVFNEYYLSTNRLGNFDVLALQYQPIVYSIKGLLTYKADGSLVPNHTLYLKDIETGLIEDTIKTDNQASYSFIGKPNRKYEFSTLNGDSLLESIPYVTYPNQKDFNYAIRINGRSPKQKADSIQTLLAASSKRFNDSIATTSLDNKFIVHYGFNKSNIQLKEKLVLDSLLNKLQKMPKTFIVVGAFTDCIGSYKYNYKLSLKRGKAVVSYLLKHGLDKNRIVSNGYSKKYNVAPCITKFAKGNRQIQQNNRRAEIVLSDSKQTNWALLEKQRGANYYAVYSNNNIVKPIPTIVTKSITKKDTVLVAKVTPVVTKKDTVAKAIVPKPIVKKDTVVVAKVTPVVTKKDTVAKVIVAKPIVKKDTVAIAKVTPVVTKKDTVAKVIVPKKDTVAKVIVPKPIIKKDTIVVAKVTPVVPKKDTVAKVIVPKPIVKKDTVVVAKVTPVVTKKDTVAKVIVPKPLVKKDTIAKVPVKASPVIIANASDMSSDDDITKEEIIKALDSLAKLKREQERIVEYLTKRINKKPIDVLVSSDSVTVELYDNGIHDKDSVSVIYNNRIVVDRQELKVNKPIKFMLKVDKNKKNNELVLVAENLGSEPPNTGVMFVTEKSGRRQQIMLSTDMTHNEVVYFIRIGKE